MITALVSVRATEEKIFLLAVVHFSQRDKLRLPDRRGISALDWSSDAAQVGSKLRDAEAILTERDQSGRIRRESELIDWPHLTQLDDKAFWRALREVLVGFHDDGTVNTAASRHGTSTGTYLWQAPFYELQTPSDQELGAAVLDALDNSS